MTRPPGRWGIIGAGAVVTKHVGDALSRGGRSLSATWSPSGRAREIALRFGGAPAASAAEVIERAEAIYIASPVDSHVAHALAATVAGRPVIVEKPFALGLGDPSVLAPSATIMVAYYRRFGRLHAGLRALVRLRRVGQPRTAFVDFAAPYAESAHWRWDKRRSGGGVVADAGSHRLDLLYDLFGPPRAVRIEQRTLTARGVETRADFRLRWSGAFEARCRFSWSGERRDLFHVVFDDGEAYWDGADPGRLRVVEHGRINAMPVAAPSNALLDILADFDARVATGVDPAPLLAREIAFDRFVTRLLWQIHTAEAIPSPWLSSDPSVEIEDIEA